VLLGVVLLVVGAAIVAGLMVMTSPAEERARRMDERRVEDLSEIDNAIDVYWSRKSALPPHLDALVREFGAALSIRDPNDANEYEYRVLDATKYELCAIFEEPSRPQRSRFGTFWNHHAGRQCFQLAAERVNR
jgi:hypothetical protein